MFKNQLEHYVHNSTIDMNVLCPFIRSCSSRTCPSRSSRLTIVVKVRSRGPVCASFPSSMLRCDHLLRSQKYDIKTEFSLIRYCTHGCWCLTLVFSCDIQNIRVEPLHGFHQLYVVILNAGETTSILDKNILESYLLC